MLKRNLTAMVVLALAAALFTSNALGQPSRQRTRVKKPAPIITETGMPIITETGIPVRTQTNRSSRSKGKNQPKWEMPDMDADINTIKTNQKTNTNSSARTRGGQKVQPVLRGEEEFTSDLPRVKSNLPVNSNASKGRKGRKSRSRALEGDPDQPIAAGSVMPKNSRRKGNFHAEKNQDIEVEAVNKPGSNGYIGETEKNVAKTGTRGRSRNDRSASQSLYSANPGQGVSGAKTGKPAQNFSLGASNPTNSNKRRKPIRKGRRQ